MKNYLMSEEESCRINIIKFIAIIFVVYIHSYAPKAYFAAGASTLNLPEWLRLFEECISQTISLYSVPIFFLISAILLFKTQRNYGKTIKNKISCLVLLFWFHQLLLSKLLVVFSKFLCKTWLDLLEWDISVRHMHCSIWFMLCRLLDFQWQWPEWLPSQMQTMNIKILEKY